MKVAEEQARDRNREVHELGLFWEGGQSFYAHPPLFCSCFAEQRLLGEGSDAFELRRGRLDIPENVVLHHAEVLPDLRGQKVSLCGVHFQPQV